MYFPRFSFLEKKEHTGDPTTVVHFDGNVHDLDAYKGAIQTVLETAMVAGGLCSGLASSALKLSFHSNFNSAKAGTGELFIPLCAGGVNVKVKLNLKADDANQCQQLLAIKIVYFLHA